MFIYYDKANTFPPSTFKLATEIRRCAVNQNAYLISLMDRCSIVGVFPSLCCVSSFAYLIYIFLVHICDHSEKYGSLRYNKITWMVYAKGQHLSCLIKGIPPIYFQLFW